MIDFSRLYYFSLTWLKKNDIVRNNTNRQTKSKISSLKNEKKKAKIIIISVLITIMLLYLFFLKIDVKDVLNNLKQFSFSVIFLVLIQIN
jgi:uncharacterized membrane protein YbhN (UPF0104 family)